MIEMVIKYITLWIDGRWCDYTDVWWEGKYSRLHYHLDEAAVRRNITAMRRRFDQCKS